VSCAAAECVGHGRSLRDTEKRTATNYHVRRRCVLSLKLP
jgi:hypothetical protein